MSVRFYSSAPNGLGSTPAPNPALATATTIASQAGGPVGQGIAAIANAVYSIFGAKVHTTAGGETYRMAEQTFYNNESEIEALYQELHTQNGTAIPSFPAKPKSLDGKPAILWVTTLIGMYLNNPSLATSNSGTLNKYKTSGIYDQAIAVQEQVISDLNAQLEAGTGGLPLALSPPGGVTALGSTSGDYSGWLLLGGAAIVAYLVLKE